MSFDRDAVLEHFTIMHDLAAGCDGVLTFTGFEEGNPKATVVQRFEIGDVVGMVDAIMAYEGHPKINLYAPWAVIRRDLPPGKRGGERDIKAVLAATADIDNDKAGFPLNSLPILPSYVVTSNVEIGNYQPTYFFERPLSVSEAKPALEALSNFIGGDSGTKDPAHVWRIPGTINIPTKSKLRRGRSPTPSATAIKQHYDGTFVAPEHLMALSPRKAQKPNGQDTSDPASLSEATIAELVSALASIPADDRDVWRNVGMGLHLIGARELWDDWSKTSDKYDVAEQEKAWSHFKSDRETLITIASIFKYAKDNGWRSSSYYEPPGETVEPPPPPNRDELILSAWLDLQLPPRDYLLGSLLCTTSRMMLIGATGIGKTLCAMEMGAGLASGHGALGWAGQRVARVMYIDGEMPQETFKERAELIASRHGRNIPFYGYNRERLGDDGMPPLNTDEGQAWLWREIDAIQPDVVFFDSIMCLLTGDIKTPEAWQPMLKVICELSARHIAQVWLHHANDQGKGFGDKSREWHLDTIATLALIEGDQEAVALDFTKTRLKTPHNRDQFQPRIIHLAQDFRVEIQPFGASLRNEENPQKIVTREFINTYDRLADGVHKSHGLDGSSLVAKVKVDDIRDEMKSRGWIEPAEACSRKQFQRAKSHWLVKIMAEKDGQIWRK